MGLRTAPDPRNPSRHIILSSIPSTLTQPPHTPPTEAGNIPPAPSSPSRPIESVGLKIHYLRRHCFSLLDPEPLPHGQRSRSKPRPLPSLSHTTAKLFSLHTSKFATPCPSLFPILFHQRPTSIPFCYLLQLPPLLPLPNLLPHPLPHHNSGASSTHRFASDPFPSCHSIRLSHAWIRVPRSNALPLL